MTEISTADVGFIFLVAAILAAIVIVDRMVAEYRRRHSPEAVEAESRARILGELREIEQVRPHHIVFEPTYSDTPRRSRRPNIEDRYGDDGTDSWDPVI